VAKKLANEGFLAKAPADVVAKTREKHEQLAQTLQKLRTTLEKIQSLAH